MPHLALILLGALLVVPVSATPDGSAVSSRLRGSGVKAMPAASPVDHNATNQSQEQTLLAAVAQGGGDAMLQWGPDNSYCMSVDGNAFQNGQKVQIWQCSTGMGQYFQYDGSYADGFLLRPAAAPGFCVVIDGNSNQNGAKIQLWECHSSELAQRWTLSYAGRSSYMLLRNAAFTDKCLVVDSNEGFNGNKLQLWDCDGNEGYKQWYSTR